jgi:hypothetical protein
MKKRIWWLIALGVLLMGVGMLGSGAILGAGRSTPGTGLDLISVTAGTGTANTTPLALDDIAAVQTAMEGSKLSWWANGQGTIGTDARNTQADVYAVSGAFQDFHHMNMLYGSFLPRTDAGAMAVVLDSDLAYRIFGTYNAVGLEVQYQGMTFQVCGVAEADSSLLGLMSGNGMFRAYVSGYDLISTGKMTIGGFEAAVKHGAPGESLSAVKTAMQGQSISTGSFLFQDRSEQQQLDAEVSLLPMILLWVTAIIVLLLFFLRSARGIGRESLSILRDSYFRNAWDALLWRFVKVLALLGGSVGLCWLMWASMGFGFYLPAKYIPGSWIDPTFYSGLIKTESQAAIAATAYGKLWWDNAYDAAVRLSHMLDMAAVIGMIITAFSLRVMLSDRNLLQAVDTGSKTPGLWDAPLLWLLALASFGLTLLLTIGTGLPIFNGLKLLLALALGLAAWAVGLHRARLEELLYPKQVSSGYGSAEQG